MKNKIFFIFLAIITMSMISQLLFTSVKNAKQSLLMPISESLAFVRNAAKKAGTTTKNRGKKCRPKHRGWKVMDGHVVPAGKILATQNTTRWHPGLHVGFGKNGTLFAIEAGKVIVTCEKIDPNWDHTWIQRHYSGREGSVIYKKHFNVIPEPQHDRFKLIDIV